MDEPVVPFAYYKRLNAAQKRTYRASDAVRSIAIPNVAPLRPLAAAIGPALASEKQRAVNDACKALVHALCDRLAIPHPKVTVRKQRPRNDWGELHGLYTWQPGETPTLEVWMRTAANARIVSYRTFVRTLLHEFGHHVDVTYLKLEDSFHTEGFLARESSFVRQLLPKVTKRSAADGAAAAADEGGRASRARVAERPSKGERRASEPKRTKPVQLELF
jgi:hypothetical protein